MNVEINLKELFVRITKERGEDIFEYGFYWFEAEEFANWLYQNNLINTVKFDEYIRFEYELFQIIDDLNPDNYEFSVGMFVLFIKSKDTEFLYKVLESVMGY